MTQMGLHPIDPTEDPIVCETCGKDPRYDETTGGELWYGSVEELDAEGNFNGYSYHCMTCLNVLARMADALDALNKET